MVRKDIASLCTNREKVIGSLPASVFFGYRRSFKHDTIVATLSFGHYSLVRGLHGSDYLR